MGGEDQTPAPGAGRQLLGQILKERGVVREGQIQEALAEQRKQGGLIGQHLVALGHATPSDIVAALAVQAGMESVDLDEVEPSEAALALIDASTAHTYVVLPLAVRGTVLTVAIGDPLNGAVLEDLAFTTGLEVHGAVADEARLRTKVQEHYGDAASIADAIAAATSVDATDAESAAQSAPVVRLLNSILHRAVQDRASDVHFECFPDELRIRYRVDGALYEIESPPAHLAAPLIARIKVMSDLDIAETKMPQDGRIALSIDGRPVDLRVATIPGIAGEGAVLRVLDRSAVSLDLVALGLLSEEQGQLAALTSLPHGIVLVTGPTGSGKTTTLYAMLSEVTNVEIKIITVEDPVEYDIEGIVQVPINEEIGVTYPRILRTVLRQDPDKILVGEIRDRDTATVAVEASLTGHLVLTTVHTNDAPSAITRLVDMGVEPFLITATLKAVVAQRLVRRICPDCRSSFEADEDLLRELGEGGEFLAGATLYYGKGCEECFHTGYRGRTMICEIMHLDDAIRAAVLDNSPTAKIRDLARVAGMRTLRESGIRAVGEGLTTVEEILRETMGGW
jgi:type IV pilus assembly protein PilB